MFIQDCQEIALQKVKFNSNNKEFEKWC
jgi:hypothetical protein